MPSPQVAQQQQLDSNEGKLNRLVAAQLCKTKMCAMSSKGTCRDLNCRFAHSPSELRPPIDLTKTAICRKFAQGKCKNPNCKFAHGEEDLRVTQSVYRTQLCNFHQRGHCKKGDRCRHAHGLHELRSFVDASDEVDQSDNFIDVDPLSYPAASDDIGVPYENEPIPSHVFGIEQIVALARQAQSPNFGTPPHSINLMTPPHSANLMRDRAPQMTPEKVVPLFPGLQRGHVTNASPMKCPMPGSLPQCVLPSESSDLMMRDGVPPPVTLEADQIDYAENLAKIAMLELQVAQLKAQQKIKYAAEMAAAAGQCTSFVGGRPAMSSSDSHFDTIMQTLRPRPPLRDIAPMNVNTTPSVLPPGLSCHSPPGLDDSKRMMPKDVFRRPADSRIQPNQAWVI